MILQGGVDSGFIIIAIIGLISSLLALYSAVKIFILSFWGETLLSEGEEKSSGKGVLLPSAILAVLVIGLGLGAEEVLVYINQAVDVLVNPSLYIQAVLS